jgi:hypothetical protein
MILNATPSHATAAPAVSGLAPAGALVLCDYNNANPLVILNRLHAMAHPSGSPHDPRDGLDFSAQHNILRKSRTVELAETSSIVDAMCPGTDHGPSRRGTRHREGRRHQRAEGGSASRSTCRRITRGSEVADRIRAEFYERIRPEDILSVRT